jgi:hypothetical protein
MTTIPKQELGSYLYFFESSMGGANCLISAHGGYVKNNSDFKLSKIGKGLTVTFYGEHKKVLSDPGLDLLSKRPVTVNEHPRDGDQILDYVLSKYQGKHSGANETYDKIEKVLAYDTERRQLFEEQMDEVNKNPDLKKIYDSLASCNVVTIRNRWNKSDISLKYVLEAVVKYKPAIKHFHCSFCRSLIGDPNPETSAVVSRP